jgi:hypothetical protein
VFRRTPKAGNVHSTIGSHGFRKAEGFGTESTETSAGSFGNWHWSLKGINNLGVLRNLRGSSTSKAKTSRRLFLWETMRSNVGNRRTL